MLLTKNDEMVRLIDWNKDGVAEEIGSKNDTVLSKIVWGNFRHWIKSSLGRVGGWMEVKAVLRIAYSNQQITCTWLLALRCVFRSQGLGQSVPTAKGILLSRNLYPDRSIWNEQHSNLGLLHTTQVFGFSHQLFGGFQVSHYFTL